MYSFSQKNLRLPATFRPISRMLPRCLVRQVARYSPSRQKSSWIEETQATSSTCRTSVGIRVQGMHSMPTVLRRPLRSSMHSTLPTCKTRHSISLSRLNKRRVPSKTARLAYKLFVRKGFRKAPAIMGYSTLGSILNVPTRVRGKTRWSSTTSNTLLPRCPTMRSSSSSNRLAKRIINTSARTRLSTVFATLDSVALASSASGLTPLMRLR